MRGRVDQNSARVEKNGTEEVEINRTNGVQDEIRIVDRVPIG